MNHPLVTVGVLSFNHGKYVANCLESIATQTYKNIEVVFLDNASKDDSYANGLEILQKSSLNYRHFKNETPVNTPGNCNFILQKANSEYLCIIAADDWMVDSCIELKMNKILENSKVGFVYGTGWWYWENTNTYTLLSDGQFQRGNIFDEIIKGNFVFAIGALLRKEAVESVGGWDENIGIEDWDMWIRLAKNWQVDYISDPTVYYRRHDNNISSNYEIMLEHQKKIIEKYRYHKSYSQSMTTAYLLYGNNFITARSTLKNQGKWASYRELIKTPNGRRALTALFESFLYKIKKRIFN